MTDATLTQKDLEPIDADPQVEAKSEAPPVDAKADAARDEPKGGSVFDGLDDGDGKGGDKPKDKPAEAEAGAGKGEKAAGDDADGKPADKPEAEANAAWRERIADKLLTGVKDKLSAAKFERRREQVIGQLKRAKSIDDAVVSGIMAQEKIRSGEHKKLSEEASPEEAAAWRKENNIPEDPAKYDIPAIPGHSWKEEDAPVLDTFKAAAHEGNLTQDQVNLLTTWWANQQQQSEAEYDKKLKRADVEDRDACYDAIRSEFGIAEFKPSMAVMKRLLEDEDLFGEVGAAKFMASRYYDEEAGMWRRTTSDPVIARGLIALGLERYGESAMPAGDGRPSVSANRLDEIDKIMKVDYDRYVREGLADEAMDLRRKAQAREDKRSQRSGR
jgi:hypothetical protein